MTIEITLLPVSCRTLHKVKKFLFKLFVNIFVWSVFIFGTLMTVIPEYMLVVLGKTTCSHYDILGGRGCGICFIAAAILFMTVLYDIKISWCIKEKSE